MLKKLILLSVLTMLSIKTSYADAFTSAMVLLGKAQTAGINYDAIEKNAKAIQKRNAENPDNPTAQILNRAEAQIGANKSRNQHILNASSGIFSSAHLKAMDCTDLSVEANNLKQSLKQQNSAIENNKTTNTSGKIAQALGLFKNTAKSILVSAANKDSALDTVASASHSLINELGNNNEYSDNDLQTSIMKNNLANIEIYQRSKKCSIE